MSKYIDRIIVCGWCEVTLTSPNLTGAPRLPIRNEEVKDFFSTFPDLVKGWKIEKSPFEDKGLYSCCPACCPACVKIIKGEDNVI